MRIHHQQQAKTEKRERTKSINTVAAKMKQVIDKMIQKQRDGEVHQHITTFLYKSQQSEITNAFFVELQKENPALFFNRTAFLSLVMERYDEFVGTFAIPVSHKPTSQQQPASGHHDDSDDDDDDDDDNNDADPSPQDDE